LNIKRKSKEGGGDVGKEGEEGKKEKCDKEI